MMGDEGLLVEQRGLDSLTVSAPTMAALLGLHDRMLPGWETKKSQQMRTDHSQQ